MKLIQSVTVGSGGASQITLSSIPQDATNLIIRASIRVTSSAEGSLFLTFNNNESSVYSTRYVQVVGSSRFSDQSISNTQFIGPSTMPGTGSNAAVFANYMLEIPSYRNTSMPRRTLIHNSVYGTNASGNNKRFLSGGDFANTTAVSRIDFLFQTFGEGTTIDLYSVTGVTGGVTTS